MNLADLQSGASNALNTIKAKSEDIGSNVASGASGLYDKAVTGASGLYDKAVTGAGAVMANPHVQKVKDYLKANPDMAKGLTAALAAGGAGALATGLGGKRYGETPGERRMRIVRNGLGAAAIGGAGYMALNKGLDYIKNPVPDNARDEVKDSTQKLMDGAAKYAPGTAIALGGAASLGAANPGMIFGNKNRAMSAFESLVKPLPAGGVGGAYADVVRKGQEMANTSKLKSHLLGQLRGADRNFSGVDLDAIASRGQSAITHAAKSVLGDKQRLADELIKAHSIGGDRASGLAAVKRLLNESNVAHGAGFWQRTKQIAGGLADRSGATDLVRGVKGAIQPNPRTQLGLMDRLRFGAKDKFRDSVKWMTSKLPGAHLSGPHDSIRGNIEELLPGDSTAARKAALDATIKAQTAKATQQAIRNGVFDSTGKAVLKAAPYAAHTPDQAGVLAKATAAILRANKAKAVQGSSAFNNIRKAIQATGSRGNLARTGAGIAGAGAIAAITKYLQSKNAK